MSILTSGTTETQNVVTNKLKNAGLTEVSREPPTVHGGWGNHVPTWSLEDAVRKSLVCLTFNPY